MAAKMLPKGTRTMEKEKKSRPVGNAARTGRDTETPDMFDAETSSVRRGDETEADRIADTVPAVVTTVAPVVPAVLTVDELPDDVRAHTRRVQALMTEVKEKICEIGAHLNEVKEQLEPGQWLRWLEAYCQLSERTAQRWMKAAATFEGDYERAAKLPEGVIYALAARSTPPEVREAILAKADAGEHLEVKLVREMIQEHKLPDAERKELEKKKKAKKKADERRQRDWAEENARIEKERQEQKEAARRAVAIIEELLGDRRKEFREALMAASYWFGEEAHEFFVTVPEQQARLAAGSVETDDA
jgi:hypothetical protein